MLAQRRRGLPPAAFLRWAAASAEAAAWNKYTTWARSKDGGQWSEWRVDASSSVSITAYLSLKVPCCGCWPFLCRSHKLTTYHFDDEYSSVSHASRTFDVQRLLKSREKTNMPSLHVKVCVLTQQEKLAARIGLDVFLDEVLRSGSITCLSLKGRKGKTVVTLILSQQLETLDEEFELKTDNDTQVDKRQNTWQGQRERQPLTHDSRSRKCSCLFAWLLKWRHLVKEARKDISQEQEAEIWVHRSIHVTPRFRDHLAGPDECFLEYLRCHYSARIYLKTSRKNTIVKGLKENADEGNLYMRDLLAKWRRDETYTEQMNVADP